MTTLYIQSVPLCHVVVQSVAICVNACTVCICMYSVYMYVQYVYVRMYSMYMYVQYVYGSVRMFDVLQLCIILQGCILYLVMDGSSPNAV